MLNANGGGLDASTSRGFSSFASNQQGGNDGSYQQPGNNFGGIQSGFGGGQMPGNRGGQGFTSMPMQGQPQPQPQQQRFPSGNLSNQLQQMGQYGQAPGRVPSGALLSMNGLGGGRGSPSPGQPMGGHLDSQQLGGMQQPGMQQMASQQLQQGRGPGLGLSGGSGGGSSGFTGQGGFGSGLGLSRMGGNFGGGGGNNAGFGPGNIGSPSRSGSLAGVFGGQQPQQQQQQAGQGHVGPPQQQQPGMQQPPTLSQPQQQQAQQQHQHMSGDLMSMLDGRGPTHTSQGSLASAVIGKYSQPPGRQAGGNEDEATLAFDEADFPSLGGGPTRPSGGAPDGTGHAGPSQGTAQPPGTVSSTPGGPTLLGGDSYQALQLSGKGQEFNMQAEEFPALPGAPRPTADGGEAPKAEAAGNQGFPGNEGEADGRQQLAGMHPGHPDYEQTVRLYAQQQAQARGMQGGAAFLGGQGDAQQSAAGKSGGGSPGGQPDVFGLLGLLSVIRMTDPDLTTLALGTDLTTLGLNLNSPDSLHKTFASPWSDGPLKPEPEFKVPSCYLHQPPRLQAGYFAKFQQDTLFYIFYSMPADEAQLLAADELSARQWWYHKDYKVWLTRIPKTEPIMKTARFERGSYLVFDTQTWDAVRKDNFVVHYDSLERPPDLPRPAPGSGAAPPGAGPGGASALKPPGSASHSGLAPGSAL